MIPATSEDAHFGFEHFPVGPGSPVLLVYGEATYDGVRHGGFGLHDYDKVGLATIDGGEPAELALIFRKLKSRAVVIWAGTHDEGFVHAQRHASLIAEAGAAAVGIVETPENDTPEDARACADAALRDALARAHPAQGAREGRAVASWVKPVEAEKMFARARAVLAHALAEPSTTLDALVLWALHAWFVRAGPRAAFETSPRLVLAANDARADHARALRLLAWLTPSPLIVSRTVASHLVAVLEEEAPTLLLDDVAGGMLYRRDMRTLIAAGAARDGLFLSMPSLRNPTGRASCFAPAAIATSAVLPDDVRVRAIVAPMAPAPLGRARPPLGAPPAEVCEIRAQMQRFAAQSAVDISAAEALMLRTFGTAARTNWAPLIAVAQAIGERQVRRALAAAEALQRNEPAPTSNLALLADIRALAPPSSGAGVTTAKLLELLTADAERPWASIRRGRNLDARELAERLRAFGLRPATLRLADDGFARGYRTADLNDAFDRYLGNVTSHVTAA